MVLETLHVLFLPLIKFSIKICLCHLDCHVAVNPDIIKSSLYTKI